MVENKQCSFRFNNFIDELVQFIFSFHIFFPAWKQLGFSQAQLVSSLHFFMADSILFYVFPAWTQEFFRLLEHHNWMQISIL